MDKTPAGKIDLREISPLALAFVGDSVLELLVRRRLVEYHRLAPGKLNAEKIKYVSARAQFREEQLLEPLFTPEELEMFKRGRNASRAAVSKHATPEEYRASTGFECLLGWLYLQGNTPGSRPSLRPCGRGMTLPPLPPDWMQPPGACPRKKPAASRTGFRAGGGSGLFWCV